ncbi:hypothetical protein Ato02nite_086300 [Paractinoplanes toevensis]|uniref:Uncharacterized protein n=1 Tax=Paractinoplanes toevensis TaxID=571911 RepID=A0A920BPK4_9ACTN|nr:hypothetical protein Ato02nite_086300 [Actinoplanes toevensis]
MGAADWFESRPAHHICLGATPRPHLTVGAVGGPVTPSSGVRPSADPLTGLSSGFLRRARSKLAGRPCGWAEGLFLETSTDPAAAAVAGYLLLRLSALDRLWNWPGNLPDQMLWMPDVAVIHAWRL